MSHEQIVLKIFEFVILLFALSLHEASHAWMASRLGDQTARMLGDFEEAPRWLAGPCEGRLLNGKDRANGGRLADALGADGERFYRGGF